MNEPKSLSTEPDFLSILDKLIAAKISDIDRVQSEWQDLFRIRQDIQKFRAKHYIFDTQAELEIAMRNSFNPFDTFMVKE